VGLLGRERNNLRHRRRRSENLIDLTPVIDITFQLLIFFLLTATFQEDSSIDVDLARAKNQQKAQKQEAVVVSITKDGAFEIGGQVVEASEMEARLCLEVRQGKDTLHVRADKDSKHEELVRAMDLAKACGFGKLGILHQN
jgi:biopolymer transport protein ExbD